MRLRLWACVGVVAVEGEAFALRVVLVSDIFVL